MMAGWISDTVFPVSRGLPANAGSTSMKKGASRPAAPMIACTAGGRALLLLLRSNLRPEQRCSIQIAHQIAQ